MPKHVGDGVLDRLFPARGSAPDSDGFVSVSTRPAGATSDIDPQTGEPWTTMRVPARVAREMREREESLARSRASATSRGESPAEHHRRMDREMSPATRAAWSPFGGNSAGGGAGAALILVLGGLWLMKRSGRR